MKNRIYDFDPAVLAKMETEMWRAYYDKRVLLLFRLSLKLLQEQLSFNKWQTLVGSYRLTAAAFVFKRGRVCSDYEKALKWLIPFYQTAQKLLNGRWQPEAVARCELEWWITHRHAFGPGNTAKLEKELAELAGMLYHIAAENLTEYAEHRALAMLISDDINERKRKGEIFSPDWAAIEAALYKSFSSLSAQIQEKISVKI